MRGVGRLIWAPALAVSMVAAGCSTANNPLGGVLGGIMNSGNSTVSGQVAGVNARAQQVFINMDNGQQIGLQYDNQTQVVYGNQSYPVRSLEPGDYVSAQIQGTGNGGYYTSYIQVQRSVSSSNNYPGSYGRYGTYPNGGNSNYGTIEGTVSQVNYNNGTFMLREPNGPNMWVSLSPNPRRQDVQIFNRLRNGNYVRVQGQFMGGNQFRLSAFQ